MASVFRKRITNKVLTIVNKFLDSKEAFDKLSCHIPPSLKLYRQNGDPPKFVLSWRDLVKLEPALEDRLHPESLLTWLQQQDWPAHDGLCNVHMEHQTEFVFNLDQQNFTKAILLEMHNELEDLCNRSSFFFPIPPQNCIVEFSSPNIAKPFHYGHFRSTMIGNFIVNLFKFVGHNVVAINYIGDWGLQYGILATGYCEFGSPEKLNEDPLSHLYEVYKDANIRSNDDPSFSDKAHKHFQKMEQGDEEVLKQWRYFRELSILKMNQTYEHLGIKFDETHGESMYADKTADIYKKLVDMSIASYESDGSLQAAISDEDCPEENVVLKKSDGTSLYLTRDIAAAIDRKTNYHFDSMYYVVDASQTQHFINLFNIIKAMGNQWYSDLHHVTFGRILNFSTRKGNAVFLDAILDEAKERTLERMKNSPTTKVTDNMEDIAEVLGISSLIVNDLSVARRKAYEFNWERVLSMKGDTGVALQYCHARLNNIKENCGVELNVNCDFSLLSEQHAVDLINHLARFDEVLHRSYIQLEPFILVHYLFQLRHTVGRANKTLTVKGQPLNVARSRLLLFHCAQLVLQKGLKILGIRPLNKM